MSGPPASSRSARVPPRGEAAPGSGGLLLGALAAAIARSKAASRLLIGTGMLSVLATCSEPPIDWVSQSGRERPSTGELSDCRMQAARQALMRYPVAPRDRRSGIAVDGMLVQLDRSATENLFYEECLRQKGYRRA